MNKINRYCEVNRKLLRDLSISRSIPVSLVFVCVFIYIFSCFVSVLIQNNHKQNIRYINQLVNKRINVENAHDVLAGEYDMITSLDSLKKMMLSRGIDLRNVDLDTIISSKEINLVTSQSVRGNVQENYNYIER